MIEVIKDGSVISPKGFLAGGTYSGIKATDGVLVLGIFANYASARRRFGWIETILKKIPVVGATYTTSKEIAGAFRGSGGGDFGTDVAIEYPKDGVWTIGFLTKVVDFENEKKHGIVYMPSTPVPNTGWMVIIPTDKIRYLDISADKAMKFIIGGGIGSPGFIDWAGREKIEESN